MKLEQTCEERGDAIIDTFFLNFGRVSRSMIVFFPGNPALFGGVYCESFVGRVCVDVGVIVSLF